MYLDLNDNTNSKGRKVISKIFYIVILTSVHG